jgi:hypothetical protein
MRHGPQSSQLGINFYVVSLLLILVWPIWVRIPESLPTKVVNCVILCVNVYCTSATGCQPNCSQQKYQYQYISYQLICRQHVFFPNASTFSTKQFSSVIKIMVHKFSKNLEATSKFQVPEEWQLCSDDPRTLGTTVQNFVLRVTWHTRFVPTCTTVKVKV